MDDTKKELRRLNKLAWQSGKGGRHKIETIGLYLSYLILYRGP